MKDTVWRRAQSLANDESAIVKSPGDQLAWIVKSLSNQQPHFVRPSKTGGYLCDDHCLDYKSAKICSHSVAVALKNDRIDELIHWFKTLKSKPNLTVLSESGKPSGVGKTPRRKASSKESTKRVREVLAGADEAGIVLTQSIPVHEGEASTSTPTTQAESRFSSVSIPDPVTARLSHTIPPSAYAVQSIGIGSPQMSTLAIGGQSIQFLSSPPPLIPNSSLYCSPPALLHSTVGSPAALLSTVAIPTYPEKHPCVGGPLDLFSSWEHTEVQWMQRAYSSAGR